MEAYLDSKGLLEIVQKGVKGVAKDRNGTMDVAAVEAKMDSTVAKVDKSKQAGHAIIQSLPSRMISHIKASTHPTHTNYG